MAKIRLFTVTADMLEASTSSPVKSHPGSSDAHSSHDGSLNETSKSDNLDLK